LASLILVLLGGPPVLLQDPERLPAGRDGATGAEQRQRDGNQAPSAANQRRSEGKYGMSRATHGCNAFNPVHAAGAVPLIT
jgi:hypothetical protein